MIHVNLWDALENCLQALEGGANLETCLREYPSLAKELRPILKAALLARQAQSSDVPPEAIERGRAKMLQAAEHLRRQRNAHK